jgi:hypothetical protein
MSMRVWGYTPFAALPGPGEQPLVETEAPHSRLGHNSL